MIIKREPFEYGYIDKKDLSQVLSNIGNEIINEGD